MEEIARSSLILCLGFLCAITSTSSAQNQSPDLVAIAPGTVVGRSGPVGWTHLVIKSIPRLTSGDLASLPLGAAKTASLFRTVIAANIEQDPKTSGIHYRIGQILLAEAGSGGSTDEAKKEFKEEIEIDPLNAAPEFVMGELARREGKWDEAVQHFTRACTLDVGFAESYLALGMSLNAWARFSDAVKPLESYVRLEPGDPAGHYQLAIAYARTGNKEGSSRELLLQTKAASSGQAATDTTEGHAVPH